MAENLSPHRPGERNLGRGVVLLLVGVAVVGAVIGVLIAPTYYRQRTVESPGLEEAAALVADFATSNFDEVDPTAAGATRPIDDTQFHTYLAVATGGRLPTWSNRVTYVPEDGGACLEFRPDGWPHRMTHWRDGQIMRGGCRLGLW